MPRRRAPNSVGHDREPAMRIGAWVVQSQLALVAGPAGLRRLRPRQLETLRALARAAPSALAIEDLKREVWGHDHVVDQAVTNAIVGLRAAFGDDAAGARVIGREGRGYRLLQSVSRGGTGSVRMPPTLVREEDIGGALPPAVTLLQAVWLSGAATECAGAQGELAERIANDLDRAAEPRSVLHAVLRALWPPPGSPPLLTHSRYQRLGEAAGIWATHCETALAAGGEEARAAFPALLLALDHGGGQCRAPDAPGAAVRELAGLLEEAGIVVRVDRGTCWRFNFLPALERWPRAHALRSAHRGRLDDWALLAAAADRWQAHGRPADFVIGAAAWRPFDALRAQASPFLRSDESAFLDTMERPRSISTAAAGLAIDLLRQHDPIAAKGKAPTAADLLETTHRWLDRERDLDPALADVALAAGRVEMNLGRFDRAERLLERSLRGHVAAGGANALPAARARLALGKLCYSRGDVAAAVGHYEPALAALEAAAPDPAEWAQALNDLAEARVAMGSFAEARTLHERALAMRRQALGANDARVGESLNNLAGVLRVSGDLTTAERHYRKAMAIQRKALGERHAEVAAVASNLAVLLTERAADGDRDEARALHERALAIRREVFGEHHPATANSLHNLAALLVHAEPTAAEPLLQASLAAHERLFGPGHVGAAAARNNLGLLHARRGEWSRAAALYRRAIADFEAAHGMAHPHLGLFLVNLADAQRARGHRRAAQSAARRAASLLRDHVAPDHPRLVKAQRLLADLRSPPDPPAARARR